METGGATKSRLNLCVSVSVSGCVCACVVGALKVVVASSLTRWEQRFEEERTTKEKNQEDNGGIVEAETLNLHCRK